jgi:hypothetical protein
MSERYLQSLAILLAGLFSGERVRSKGFPLGLAPPSTEEGPSGGAVEPSKEKQH